MQNFLPIATVFTPKDIAGLNIWLDAKTISQSNATTLTAWNDISGKNNSFTQATSSKQPIFYTGSNRPYVRFDGIDDCMQSNNALSLTKNIAGVTVCMIYKFRSIGTSLYNTAFCASVGTSATTSRVALGISINGNYHVGGRRLDTDLFERMEYNIGQTNFDIVQIGYLNYAQAKMRLINNGGFSTEQVFQTAGNTSNTDSLGVYIGSKNSTELSAVDIYECAVYNRVLTDAELKLITRYFGAKWGIYVAT